MVRRGLGTREGVIGCSAAACPVSVIESPLNASVREQDRCRRSFYSLTSGDGFEILSLNAAAASRHRNKYVSEMQNRLLGYNAVLFS